MSNKTVDITPVYEKVMYLIFAEDKAPIKDTVYHRKLLTWELWLNGCSEEVNAGERKGLPPYHLYVEFMGQPYLIMNPSGGIIYKEPPLSALLDDIEQEIKDVNTKKNTNSR